MLFKNILHHFQVEKLQITGTNRELLTRSPLYIHRMKETYKRNTKIWKTHQESESLPRKQAALMKMQKFSTRDFQQLYHPQLAEFVYITSSSFYTETSGTPFLQQHRSTWTYAVIKRLSFQLVQSTNIAPSIATNLIIIQHITQKSIKMTDKPMTPEELISYIRKAVSTSHDIKLYSNSNGDSIRNLHSSPSPKNNSSSKSVKRSLPPSLLSLL